MVAVGVGGLCLRLSFMLGSSVDRYATGHETCTVAKSARALYL